MWNINLTGNTNQDFRGILTDSWCWTQICTSDIPSENCQVTANCHKTLCWYYLQTNTLNIFKLWDKRIAVSLDRDNIRTINKRNVIKYQPVLLGLGAVASLFCALYTRLHRSFCMNFYFNKSLISRDEMKLEMSNNFRQITNVRKTPFDINYIFLGIVHTMIFIEKNSGVLLAKLTMVQYFFCCKHLHHLGFGSGFQSDVMFGVNSLELGRRKILKSLFFVNLGNLFL